MRSIAGLRPSFTKPVVPVAAYRFSPIERAHRVLYPATHAPCVMPALPVLFGLVQACERTHVERSSVTVIAARVLVVNISWRHGKIAIPTRVATACSSR